jgi:recombination protein RecR
LASLPKPISDLITAFERLPGIGPKSATRLVFFLLNAPQAYNEDFASLMVNLKKKIKVCRECFSVSEEELCEVCGDSRRSRGTICVVERAIDVMALENVGGYRGVYHVLGGVINPLEHVGPEDLRISELIERIQNLPPTPTTAGRPPLMKGGEKNTSEGGVVEVILAMNSTMEGEGTALYIKKQIENLEFKNLKITRIGSGLPMGSDLEFADQATLSRAMEGRRIL